MPDDTLSARQWQELSALIKKHGAGMYDVIGKCWPGSETQNVPTGDRFYPELLERLRRLEKGRM